MTCDNLINSYCLTSFQLSSLYSRSSIYTLKALNLFASWAVSFLAQSHLISRGGKHIVGIGAVLAPVGKWVPSSLSSILEVAGNMEQASLVSTYEIRDEANLWHWNGRDASEKGGSGGEESDDSGELHFDC